MDSPLHPGHRHLQRAWTPLLPACPRKAEAAVCIILGRGADLEERIRRKQEEEQACHRTQRPLAACGNFGFWGHVPRRPALPPPPPHPPHEVLANPPGGHKVAASPQGSKPGGVTPGRRRPELGHPACGHSVCGGHRSVSTSFLPTSTCLLCSWVPAGSRGTLCPQGIGEARRRAEDAEKGREPGGQAKRGIH